MLRRIDLRNGEPFEVPRALPEGQAAAVTHIIDEVRTGGAQAVLDAGSGSTASDRRPCGFPQKSWKRLNERWTRLCGRRC